MNENNTNNIHEPIDEMELELILAEFRGTDDESASEKLSMSDLVTDALSFAVRMAPTPGGNHFGEAEIDSSEPEPEPGPEPEPEPSAPNFLPQDGQQDESPPDEGALPDSIDFITVSDGDDTYASAVIPEIEVPDEPKMPAEKHRSPGQVVANPLLAILSLVAVKQHERKNRTEERTRSTFEGDVSDEPDIPEMVPAKAAKLYSSQIRPLKLRAFLSLIFTLVLAIISYLYCGGHALAGSMADNITVTSLMCLVLELAVILFGLDIFTAGLTSLFRGNAGGRSLVSLSCLFSAIDALVIAITGSGEWGIPFCAVSAASMTFALWGARLTCTGRSRTFRSLAKCKTPFSVTCEPDIVDDGEILLKAAKTPESFVRRTEAADNAESAYSVCAPFLIVAALILSILATYGNGSVGSVMHCVSACFAACASFSSMLCFALPFCVSARRLRRSSAAIAGYEGCRSIGSCRRVAITDHDIFPEGTVSVTGIRILEGVFNNKVISYTGSVIDASGCGLSGAFAEVMLKNNCTVQRVDDFASHEGGGLTASIKGEKVYVGSSGFMSLMGIRMPQNLKSKTSVFVAISGHLVGIFAVKYVPIISVQDALVTLMHSKRSPLFAIRDFNVTPLLIRQRFRMPTEGFDFPSYSERYRVSAAVPGERSAVSAVMSKDGIGPFVEIAERGRRIYAAARLGVLTSLLCSFIGLALMFLLCWLGAFDSANVANLTTFMLLWLLPVLVASFALRR